MYASEAALFAGIALVARRFSLPAVLALAMIDGALAVTAKALTRSATAAGLMEEGLLREGNGIMNLGVMAATAGSPIIAGALAAWKGPRAALFVDAATFLVTALIVATAKGVRVETDPASSFATRLRNGTDAIRKRPTVSRLMIAIAIAMLLSAVPLPIEVVFAKRTLHAGDLGYGLLLGSWGVGMVLGAAGFTLATQTRLVRILVAGTLLIAVAYGGLALAPSLVVACVASAIGGTGNGAGWVAAVTAVQERVPLRSQSAVMTVLEGLSQAMPALGFLVGGILTALSSPRLAYAVAAGGVAAILLIGIAKPVDHVLTEAPGISGDAAPDASGETQEIDPPQRNRPLPTFTIG
jgi:MFS family permease